MYGIELGGIQFRMIHKKRSDKWWDLADQQSIQRGRYCIRMEKIDLQYDRAEFIKQKTAILKWLKHWIF